MERWCPLGVVLTLAALSLLPLARGGTGALRYEQLLSLALSRSVGREMLEGEDARLPSVLRQLQVGEYGRRRAQILDWADADDFCSGLPALNVTVSETCCNHSLHFLSSLAGGQMWAKQMLDAQGKIPSGILEGDLVYPGAFDECRSVVAIDSKNNSNKVLQEKASFHGRYCQATFPIKGMQLEGILLRFGLCVPSSCNEADVTSLIQHGMHLLPKRLQLQYNLTGHGYCPKEELHYDVKAIVSLIVCSLFIFVMAVATLYDVVLTYLAKVEMKEIKLPWNVSEEKQVNGSIEIAEDDASLNVPYKIVPNEKTPLVVINAPKSSLATQQGYFGKFILSFSVYTNGARILNTQQSSGSLKCIHGVRFLSMTWVVLGHTYAFAITVTRNMVKESELLKRWTFQAIGNALVSVDSFFLMSGLLLSYLTLKELKKNDGKLNWFMFYFHRFWRLTPPYMLVMLVYIPLFRYWSDGPIWPQQGIEVNYCVNTWWTNLLYINNFVTDISKGMCMGWSWYLANDMQFFIISPLILIPLYRSRLLGGIVISVFLLGSFIATGLVSRLNDLQVNMFSLNMDANFISYFKLYYIRPYCRIGPYLVGIMYGYILYRTECKVQMNKYLAILGWAVAAVCCLSVLYGLCDNFRGHLVSLDVAAFYNTVHRSVWALGLGWVIFACVTGYGGFINTLLTWDAFLPLSRLTYCTYLIHPIIMYFYYFSNRYMLYVTDIMMIYIFLGHVFISYGVAFIVSLAFESPMLQLEKLFLKRERRS